MRFLLSFIVLFTIGCASLSTNPVTEKSQEGTILIVKDRQDPFEISNMRKTITTLSKIQIDTNKVLPNYYYVKFTCHGNIEKGQLENWDSSLVIQPFPLDKEIIQYGRDTSLSVDTKVYYAAIPVGYTVCPNIKCDTLKELFLPAPPTDDSSKLTKSSTLFGIDPREIEYWALKRAGDNRVSINNLGKAAWFGSGYRPEGYIKYTDDVTGQILRGEGERITYGYYYYWEEKRTNSVGYFRSSSTWTWGVDYHLHFDAPDFEFENYTMIEGPHSSKMAWNTNFTGFNALLATIFEGCWQWWYRDMDGLGRPHQNAWYKFRMSVNIYNRPSEVNDYGSYGTNHYAQWADIFLRRVVSETVQTINCHDAYNTIMHEIAHSSHFCNFTTRFWNIPRLEEFNMHIATSVVESYSTGIAWQYTKKRYGIYANESGLFFNGYTGLIPDLVDTDINFVNATWGEDYVSGYSMLTVGSVFYNSFEWNELKTKMWDARPVPTYFSKGQFDYLFDFWRYDYLTGNWVFDPVHSYTLYYQY